MFTCLKSDFNILDKRVKSICKKLDKYNLSYTYKILSEEVKDIPLKHVDALTNIAYVIGTVPVEVVNYEFTMEELKIGDYIPVAVIEHNSVLCDDGILRNNVVILDKEGSVNSSWWNIKGHCDDCNDNYLRKKTVIIKNIADGTYKQVGTGCLKKYTGIDCWDVISAYSSITEFLELESKELYIDSTTYNKNDIKYINTDIYLACCIYTIEQDDKYVKSDEDEATKEKAHRLALSIIKDEITIDNFSSYINKAKDIMNWCKENEEYILNNLYGFERDVCLALLNKYTKKSGAIAYAPILYKQIVKKQEEQKNMSKSNYIGNVGDKLTLNVKVMKVVNIDTIYGCSFLNIFSDENGNILTWFTKSKSYVNSIDNIICITGTVKEHNIYKDQKQTALIRVKEN